MYVIVLAGLCCAVESPAHGGLQVHEPPTLATGHRCAGVIACTMQVTKATQGSCDPSAKANGVQRRSSSAMSVIQQQPCPRSLKPTAIVPSGVRWLLSVRKLVCCIGHRHTTQGCGQSLPSECCVRLPWTLMAGPADTSWGGSGSWWHGACSSGRG